MKKVFVFLLLGIFMIGFCSAFEFDNVKSYNPITREVTIINAFGMGDEIGKARLNTPLNVKVGAGYQKVAEFDLWAYNNYNDALKQLTFSDMNNGRSKINKDYDLKRFNGMKTITTNIYGCEDKTVFCSDVHKIGTQEEEVEDWIKITPADLRKNEKIKVGVFVTVEVGDYVDWVPMIFGVEVEEWATWTADLNVDILSYWKLDDTYLDELEANNGTNSGTDFVPGKINNGSDFEVTETDYIDLGSNTIDLTDGNFTINAWVKLESVGIPQAIIGGHNSGYVFQIGNTNNIKFGKIGVNEVASTQTIGSGIFIMLTVTYDTSANLIQFYIDGTQDSGGTDAYSSTFSATNYYLGVRDNGGLGDYFDGIIDEPSVWTRVLSQAEITQVFNDYTGISYTDVFVFAPTITLNSPSSANFTTPQTLQINFTASDDVNLTNVQLFVNEVLNQSNASGINNSDYLFDLSLGDGDYTIYGTATDNESQQTNSSSIRIVIDSTLPQFNNVTPNTTTAYFLMGSNETLNTTITDTNLDSCWFDYNGTNITIEGCVSGVQNYTSFLYQLGNNNITIYANDSFGNLNSTFTSWGYRIIEINQTYNNQTLEGATEDFSAIIRLGDGESIIAVAFVYNGSATAGVNAALGNNTEIKLENFVIPQVSTKTNITFNWSVILTGGEIINLTSQNQTVGNLAVDNCSAFTNQILNITMVDEEEQTPLLNTTLEVAINLLSVDRSQTVVSLSGSFGEENPIGICLSENVTNETMYSLDAILKYTAEGYAIEYYNLVNFSLDNETKTQSITLYNLNASDSTDFQLTFNGEDFLPVEGALVFVERQYIAENIFKTVELPKTDSNGQTILHLVRNDIIYNIRIVKEGEALASFLNIIAFCQDFTIGDCTLPLNAQSKTTGIFNYDDEIGILYDSPPTYNATTNIVSFAFTSTSGSTKIVKMNVERRDIFGNNSICDNTLVSTSGTVSCNIGVNLSDTTLFTTITIDGEKWIADTTQIDKTNFGSIGFVVWFFLSIALLLMFSESKNGVMISIAISYIGAVTLGLVTGTITGVGSAGIWMLVITSIGIWKINKNRSS